MKRLGALAAAVVAVAIFFAMTLSGPLASFPWSTVPR